MTGHAYLVASRQGLYRATRESWRLLAEGAFFGIACAGSGVFAFRHDSRSGEAAQLSGRIVHYRWQGDGLREDGVVADGLDHNCHQLDHFDDAFFLVDTLNQQILEYRSDWTPAAGHRILPPAPRDGPGYAHLNSIAGTADTIWVMLHNKARGRPSEIVELDRNFRERGRIELPCSGCHDIVPMPDGRLLTCLSPLGEIALVPGETHKIDELWTRGLVVGPDEIVVGSSLYGNRVRRALLPGFLTFLDPGDYGRLARLYLPAAPTQIRRIAPELAES
ncbi:MAG TPA: hypothetical protein VEW26_04405 [Allosphingosinicella sp.]|nr:hypothetical protein [Allosphingosinicella sp.]